MFPNAAQRQMSVLNPNAFQGEEGAEQIFIEDITDADRRVFRVEYRCNDDGRNATAYLLYDPWSGNPYPYEDSHLGDDGFICIGKHVGHTRSPYNLDFAVRRVRFWCNGYSFLQEHGIEATRRLLPEW